MAETGASTLPLAVHVKTLGCKVNQAESEAMASELLGNGVHLVAETDASVVLLNTCTVTGEADRKARKAVRHALSSANEPVVVVTGCLAALDAHGLEALGERVVVEPRKEEVPARIARILGAKSPPEHGPPPPARRARSRVAVKVADGCDSFCAYCIVPYARGAPRSVPLGEVVREVEGLIAAGVSEVVLTGINIGAYDSAGITLAELVFAVAATGVARLRLSSVEPLDLTPSLLDALGSTPSVCPHLHVPLQSGSDEVLARMGRRYTSGEYAERIERAREAIPGLAVTADVIAGFPGETERDLRRTARFVEEVGLTRLHVFRYSPRANTPAADMVGQVSSDVRARRADELRELDSRLRSAYIDRRLGEPAQMLVERVICDSNGVGLARGTTGDYLSVRLPAEGLSAGEVVDVRLLSQDGNEVSVERL